jgi:ubiquinone/menaquinone biosynthesis C-methylase UbiE
MISIFDYLKETLPTDHARQTRAIDIAGELVADIKPNVIVDLGCGTGVTYDFFREHAPGAHWIGVDIEESPEVNQRVRKDVEFRTYDGVNLPFADASLDFIFSNQVFEHVRYPEKLLADISRVLRFGGTFVGQTSQLEPYHSYSLWNFTLYGFKTICDDAGLKVTQYRPGIDGHTLVERAFKGRSKEYSQWFNDESPKNKEIESLAMAEGRRINIINFRKLMNCGQFCFICTKPDDFAK